MRHLILTLTLACTTIFAQAEIVETTNIETILPHVTQDSLVLFNIAEVLTDSTVSLGSSPSRKYFKKTAPEAHDALTWLIATKVPHKAVEEKTAEIIQKLQDDGVIVAALTSRGRTEWYTTQIQGVDDLTERMLYANNIDLTRNPPPIVSIQMEGSPYLSHYRNGIYYCNHMEKGEFLKDLFTNSGYLPAQVVLIDDKRDSLESVDAAMQEMGIPFVGILYTHSKLDHAEFNPMVAILQLKHLVETETILSENEAEELARTVYADVDADSFFLGVLDMIDLSQSDH